MVDGTMPWVERARTIKRWVLEEEGAKQTRRV
jgi:hypothetical protein